MRQPLDESIKYLREIPYTISYVIRKRIQVDNLNELPKDKRPPELTVWNGTSEDIDNWIDRVYSKKEQRRVDIMIPDNELE